MNLYRGIFEHWSQKDSERGISGYFFAENDREAYDKVYGTEQWDDCMTVDRIADSDPEEHWEKEGLFYFIDGKEYPENITEEEVRQIVADKGGELNFDELDSLNCWDDLYYGQTVRGWELVHENLSENDIIALKRLKIIEVKDD